MKRTGICPKCQSTDLVRIEGNAGAYGSGNNIQLGMTIFSAVKVILLNILIILMNMRIIYVLKKMDWHWFIVLMI